MKRIFIMLFAVIFSFVTIGIFSGCDVTDALDLVLENEELAARNSELESENQELKDYIDQLESQLRISNSSDVVESQESCEQIQ